MVAMMVATAMAPVAAAAPKVTPMSIQCTATGLKHFGSQISAEQLCQRFAQAFGRARGTAVATRTVAPGQSGLVVELGFRLPGIASARVAQLAAGKSRVLPLYELAVSDRKFLSSDIDRLAVDVARGLNGGSAGGNARKERN